ncbi:hypothetical protein [Marinobacter sp. ELB17]|uniref:hypothetical protein n=1 Tax=Marinobacter sp. ELB17 TaxID=270374 RepID=UPI0000F3704F|nr:hypothetical protein [Marinobacter sp. ELB17]EAZ97943.1 hypothetical protein MELB17_13762 [Marinobacter sp. ELB17]
MSARKAKPKFWWCATAALAATLAWAPAMANASAEFHFTGSARPLGSANAGSELYREQHTIQGVCRGNQFKPQSHRVEYFDASSDTPFASKQLRYDRGEQPSLLRPDVEFVQPRFNERLTVGYDSGSVAIEWQSPAQGVEQFRLDSNNSLVVDSGFDNLVRQNWQTVVEGGSVNFEFLAPTRGSYYGFVMEPADNKSNSDRIRADHLIQIRPTSLFLRLIVEPILLGYNQQGALTHYSGLTNIRLNQQENIQADIVYSVTEYPPCPLLAP